MRSSCMSTCTCKCRTRTSFRQKSPMIYLTILKDTKAVLQKTTPATKKTSILSNNLSSSYKTAISNWSLTSLRNKKNLRPKSSNSRNRSRNPILEPRISIAKLMSVTMTSKNAMNVHNKTNTKSNSMIVTISSNRRMNVTMTKTNVISAQTKARNSWKTRISNHLVPISRRIAIKTRTTTRINSTTMAAIKTIKIKIIKNAAAIISLKKNCRNARKKSLISRIKLRFWSRKKWTKRLSRLCIIKSNTKSRWTNRNKIRFIWSSKWSEICRCH